MAFVPEYLRNVDAVRSAFGCWPSFHDAKLSGFRWDADGEGTIEFALHAFLTSSAIDERGYFVREKAHVVRFRFRHIADAQLDAFVRDNVLFELGFSPADEDGWFSVELDSAMGSDCGGRFRARDGEVVSVTP